MGRPILNIRIIKPIIMPFKCILCHPMLLTGTITRLVMIQVMAAKTTAVRYLFLNVEINAG